MTMVVTRPINNCIENNVCVAVSNREKHVNNITNAFAVLNRINTQSSFTVQNPRAQLVKIEHVILLYLTSANSDSALLTITHKNRALLTMASADLQK